MNTHIRRLTLAAGCLLAASLTATATPLKRSDLAADPAWVAHIDVDALLATSIGQYLQGELAKPEAQAKLAAFQAIVGFDLQKQLHALTLYGTSSTPEDGVLIVYSDFDADRLVTLAKAAEDYQSQPHNSHVIHHWIDANKKSQNGVRPGTYAAIIGARVIFGQRQAAVAAAMDVIDGVSPTLANSTNFPQLGANAGFIQGSARKLDLPDTDPNAAMFRLSKLISLDMGEAQGQTKATLTLQANDEITAQLMGSIGQGLIALGKLQTSSPETTKVVNAVSLKQDGASVIINLTMSSADVIAAMKADAAKKAAKQ